MKVKALRLAAYLLIAHFLIVVALAFLSKGGPEYTHLALALALLFGATGALFSPRRRLGVRSRPPGGSPSAGLARD